MAEGNNFSHFDASGNARMVDVGSKNETSREAIAAGTVIMNSETFRMVQEGTAAKGDAIGVPG
jgi:cyclic pyranopterin phosphate synthase